MHRQPIFRDYESVGGSVADDLFDRGLCLPSSSSLTRNELERVTDVVRRLANRSCGRRGGGSFTLIEGKRSIHS